MKTKYRKYTNAYMVYIREHQLKKAFNWEILKDRFSLKSLIPIGMWYELAHIHKSWENDFKRELK